MKKVLTGMLVVSGLLSAAPATAATTWSFNTGGDNSSTTYGNTRTYSSDGVQVAVSAFSNTSGNENVNLESAYVGSYGSSGLGVSNQDEGINPGSPNHSNDNYGKYDVLLLSFAEAVNLTSVRNGWVQTDSDLTVAAYLGASAPPSLAGESYNDLVAGGWNNIASLSNPGTSWASTNNTTTYSSYWLVGALNPAFASSVDANTDYTKLYKVKGTICTAPGGAFAGSCGGQPGTGVSEPGSLALAGLGLLGVMGLRRRQH